MDDYELNRLNDYIISEVEEQFWEEMAKIIKIIEQVSYMEGFKYAISVLEECIKKTG